MDFSIFLITKQRWYRIKPTWFKNMIILNGSKKKTKLSTFA